MSIAIASSGFSLQQIGAGSVRGTVRHLNACLPLALLVVLLFAVTQARIGTAAEAAKEPKTQFENEIRELDNKINRDPTNAENYGSRALYFSLLGETAKATADYTQAIALESDTEEKASSYSKRAREDEKAGNVSQAISDCTQVIALSTKARGLYMFHRAQTFLRAGDFENAVADYDEMISLNPHDWVAFKYRGAAQYDHGEFDKAISDYTEAIKNVLSEKLFKNDEDSMHERQSELLAKRACAFDRKGNFERAMADFNQAIQLDPKNVQAYEKRATVRSHYGQYDDAITDYDQALQIHPKSNSAHVGRAQVRFDQGRFDDAIAEYDNILKDEPNNQYVLVMRAFAWRGKGDYQKAISDISQAIHLGATPGYCFGRALLLSEKGDYESSLADFNAGFQLDPKNAFGYQERGKANWRKGHYEDAIADFNHALEINPKDAQSLLFRGEVHALAGDYDQAIADFNEGLKLDSKSTYGYLGRGDAWDAKGEHDIALADYNEAIRIDPKSASAYVSRGGSRVRSAEYEKALSDFNEALRLEPKNISALNALARLLATCPKAEFRNGKQAVELATKAGEAGMIYLDTFAAALAETGDFSDAVDWQRKAITQLNADGKPITAAQSRLDLYLHQQPYREYPGTEKFNADLHIPTFRSVPVADGK